MSVKISMKLKHICTNVKAVNFCRHPRTEGVHYCCLSCWKHPSRPKDGEQISDFIETNRSTREKQSALPRPSSDATGTLIFITFPSLVVIGWAKITIASLLLIPEELFACGKSFRWKHLSKFTQSHYSRGPPRKRIDCG